MSPRHRPRVMIVSKPLSPPWNDSSKNLAKDIVLGCRNTDFRILTTPQHTFAERHIISEPIYASHGKFAPSFHQQIRVFCRLLQKDPDVDIYHFFFAPNPLTLRILKWIFKFKPRKPVLHTLCSQPDSYEAVRPLIFADHMVTLSKTSENHLISSGLRNVSYIPPGIHLERSIVCREANPYQSLKSKGDFCILFAGDYEYSGAHTTILGSLPQIFRNLPQAKVFFTCRIKTPRGTKIGSAVQAQIKKQPFASRVYFFEEIPNMLALIQTMDISIFPSTSLYHKMDVPLVLLECLANQIPLVVSDLPELEILGRQGAALVIPQQDAARLAEAVIRLGSDHELYARLKKNALHLAATTFNIENVCRDYESLYAKLMDLPNPDE